MSEKIVMKVNGAPSQSVKMLAPADYYKVVLVGAPGRGKTYAFRNMDEKTTGFINVENKPLPFSKNFLYHARPTKYAGFMQALNDFSNNTDIKSVVIDSMSAVFDMLLEECESKYKGYDIWSNYNKELRTFFKVLKNIPKIVFATAHYETLNIEGAPEKRIKVQGKSYEGNIEREFTAVLYADSKVMPNQKRPKYSFILAEPGTSAKCPPEIFGEDIYEVDNDAANVYEKVVQFIGA